MDPCEKEPTDALQSVALQDREEITEAAQVLYKELAGSIFSTPIVKLGVVSHCRPTATGHQASPSSGTALILLM